MEDPNRKKIEEIYEQYKKAFETINDPIRKEFEEFNKQFSKALEIMNDPVKKEIEAINTRFGKVLETINDPIRKEFEEFNKQYQRALKEINDPFRKALEDIENNPMKKALEAIEKASPTPGQYQLPELRMEKFQMRNLPTQQETNEYQSAGVLMRRIADSIIQWRDQLPANQQPAILAILNGGIQIDVERLAQESFHGIRIEGKLGSNPCMVLAHQATVQLICYVEEIEKDKHRRTIGFIIDGKEEEV